MSDSKTHIYRENFTLTGKNGLPMSCDVHFPEHEQELPTAIYAHGINGFKDWGGMNLIAEKFARAGMAFVKFNFSHNGTTPAHPCDFTDLESYGRDNYLTRQADLKNMVDFLCSAKHSWPLQKSNIYLIGHSRGGTDALLYTANDQRIKKLITWSAPAEATTPWRKWDAEKLKLWRETQVVHTKNGRTGQEMPIYYQLYQEYQKHRHGALNTEEKARQLKQAWLICHGEADQSVFVKDAYQLKQWQPEAEVLIIPETGHTYDRKHPWAQNQLPPATKKLVDKCLTFLNPAS